MTSRRSVWTKAPAVSAVLLLFAAVAPSVHAAPAKHAAKASIPYGGTVYAQAGNSGFGTRDFNPFSPTVESGAIGLIYEPLLMYNLQGQPTVRPWLASSYAWSNHNLTLTFHLRQGVEWQNGTPFTSKDVVFTFDLLKQYPAIDYGAFWNVLTAVRADGPYTVVFTFKQADVPILYYLGGQVIVPASIWAHENPITWQDPNPVGTGPFELQSFSSQSFTLRRNPHYWQTGHPYISDVVYRTASAAILSLALRSGQLNLASGYIPDVQKTYVAADAKYNHYWWAPGQIVGLFPNDAVAPFNNVNVRRGLAYLIPYSAIVSDSANSILHQADAEGLWLPAQKAWLDPALVKQYDYRYDPALALKYFAQAGYHKNSAGELVNGAGQQLSFTLYAPFANWTTADTVMAAVFNQNGLHVSVEQETPSTYFANLRNGHFQIALNWMGSGPSPYYSFNGPLNDAYTAPIGQTALNDVERWRSPATQALLAEYTRTSSPAKQRAAIYGLEKIMATQLPVIPVFFATLWDEYVNKTIVGWPNAQNPYANGGSFGELTEPTFLNVHLRN